MELHRTETARSNAGALVIAHVLGIEPHEGQTRELVLGLKYGRKRMNARLLADIVVDSITWSDFNVCVFSVPLLKVDDETTSGAHVTGFTYSPPWQVLGREVVVVAGA